MFPWSLTRRLGGCAISWRSTLWMYDNQIHIVDIIVSTVKPSGSFFSRGHASLRAIPSQTPPPQAHLGLLMIAAVTIPPSLSVQGVPRWLRPTPPGWPGEGVPHHHPAPHRKRW